MGPQQTEIISLIECLVSWVVSCFENDLCSMIFDRKWRLLFSLWTETDCVFMSTVCVCVCVPSVRVCYSHCETNYKTLHVTTITGPEPEETFLRNLNPLTHSSDTFTASVMYIYECVWLIFMYFMWLRTWFTPLRPQVLIRESDTGRKSQYCLSKL